MPKVSQEVARETRRRIIRCSLDIVVKKGEKSLSFQTIADAANISRSGINAHFKRKEHLFDEIRPMLSEMILAPLDLSSPEGFLATWKKVIDNDADYRQLLTNCSDIMESDGGAKNLLTLIEGDSQKVKDAVCYAVGYAKIYYPESK